MLLGILAITCCGRTAAAQSIDEVVHPGRVVRVDDRDGHILTGKVFRVSAQTLELMVGSHTETIPVGRIWSVRVQYKDPIRDGARKGALTGLLVGAALGVIGAISTCGDEGQFIDFCSGGGAATGLIGDALQPSYRVVWRAPVTTKIAFSVTRVTRGTGAVFSFRW